jgi:hypothetical protein
MCDCNPAALKPITVKAYSPLHLSTRLSGGSELLMIVTSAIGQHQTIFSGVSERRRALLVHEGYFATKVAIWLNQRCSSGGISSLTVLFFEHCPQRGRVQIAKKIARTDVSITLSSFFQAPGSVGLTSIKCFASKEVSRS